MSRELREWMSSNELREWCAVWFNPELKEEDRDWIRTHMEMAGGLIPEVDISWVSTEWTG